MRLMQVVQHCRTCSLILSHVPHAYVDADPDGNVDADVDANAHADAVSYTHLTLPTIYSV